MDPLEFRLSSAEVAEGAFVLTLAGELDLHRAQDVDGALDALETAGARQVIVDLLEVPFIESSILGVLLQHARRLRANGGELTIVTDDARILRVFDITGLRSHFRFERSLSTAIEDVFAQVIG